MQHAFESSEPVLDDNGLRPIRFPVYVEKLLSPSVLENIRLLAEELAPFEYLVTEEGLPRAEVIELLEDGGVFNGMADFLTEFLNPFLEKIFDDIRKSIKKNPNTNVRAIIGEHTRSLETAMKRAMTERPILFAFLCELTDITACTVMLHGFMRDELKKNPSTLRVLGVQENDPHWYEEFVNEYSKLAYNGDPAKCKKMGVAQLGQYEYKRLQCLYGWMLFASILRQGNPVPLDHDFVKQCKEEADKMCGVVKEMDFDLPDEGMVEISASEYARGSFPTTYAIGSTIDADLNLFSMFQGVAQMRISDGKRIPTIKLEFGFSRVLNDLTLPFIDMFPARRVLELYGVDQGYCDLIRFNFLKALLETHGTGKKDPLEEKMAEIFSNPAVTGIFKSLGSTPLPDSIEIEDEEESTGQNNGGIRLHNLSQKKFIRALVRCGALLARSSRHLVFKRKTAGGTYTSIVSHGANSKGHRGRLFEKTLKELGIPVNEFAAAAGLGR